MKTSFLNLNMLFTLRFIVSITVYVGLLHIYTGSPSNKIDKFNPIWALKTPPWKLADVQTALEISIRTF